MEEVKHLPSEVVSEILSRLPIESLMRFKSVCKSWFSLIEDPSFIKMQLKISKSRPHRLILWESYEADKIFLLDTDKEGKDILKARGIDLEHTWKFEEQEDKLLFDIVGSCNGLLCMVSHFSYGCCSQLYGIFICNPITKECVMLPVTNGRYYQDGQIGFGMDSTGKYKVIQIFRYRDHDLKGEIITLGESSWREIEVPYWSDYTRCDAAGIAYAVEGMVFINGVLYCIIKKPTIHNEPMVLVFDLYDEKFRTIECCKCMELPNYYELGVTEIEGSLALYHRRGESYAVGKSYVIRTWLRLIEINESEGNELFHCDPIEVAVTCPNNIYDYFDLAGMLRDNLLLYRVNDRNYPELVTERGSHLLVFCLDENQLMRVRVSGAIPRRFHAKSFVPSLVSPILIACGKAKKDNRSRVRGLHLEVVGYSSLWELMDSYRLHPTFHFRDSSSSSCPHGSPPSD